MKRWSWLILLGVALLVADILSKWWVQGSLPHIGGAVYPYGGIGIFRNFLGIQFSLVHHVNRGAIWGLFSSHPYLLFFFRLGLIAALIVYLVRYNRERRARLPLILILAGAIGNVIDIFCYGHVVDYFYFILWGWHYPVFNLADSFIFIGISILLIHSFIMKRRYARIPVDRD